MPRSRVMHDNPPDTADPGAEPRATALHGNAPETNAGAGGGSPASGPVLSVVIPMYMEEARIGATLRDVIATLDSWELDAEVLGVDDGSTDRTPDVVRAVARELARAGSVSAGCVRVLSHERNRGKGAAVLTALRRARGAWVLMMDADNSARLAELARLASAAATTGAGLVVGSRVGEGAEVETDPRRRASGLVFRAALGALGMGYVRDTQCGFKLYRRDAARLCAAHGREHGFAFDLEHIGLCLRSGLGVAEVGIRWEHRDGGTVHVVRDGLRMLAQARRIRLRLRAMPAREPRPLASDAQVELKPLLRNAPAPAQADDGDAEGSDS